MNHLTDKQLRNINQVIDWLESPYGQSEFDMRIWGTNSCGTAMCIGGYIQNSIIGKPGSMNPRTAGAAIGVSWPKVNYAFMINELPSRQKSVTPERAIEFLKNWRDKGVLDWDI